MKAWAALRGRQGVVLDTMVWIYLFEDHPRYAPICERLAREAAAGTFTGVISPITLAEVLVKPLQTGRLDIAERYRTTLATMPGMATRVVDAEIGVMAGALRAHYNRPLPDMIQAALALREPAATLVTNDKALRGVRELRVILLSEL